MVNYKFYKYSIKIYILNKKKYILISKKKVTDTLTYSKPPLKNNL